MFFLKRKINLNIYIDFPKISFGKSSRSFSSKWYMEFPWLHYNLYKEAVYMSAEINLKNVAN